MFLFRHFECYLYVYVIPVAYVVRMQEPVNRGACTLRNGPGLGDYY